MKAIIVTGASAGIGRAVAERFLADGWQVGLIARRAELLEEMAEGRANAVILPCDVAEADQVDRAFAEFAAKAGRLDVLFNNAGIFTSAAPIDEVPVEDWMRAVSVNLTGMFLCARAAFGQMRRQSPQGGRIALLGIPPGKSPVDWSRIVFKAITIKGVYGREIFETWYKMIAMLENGLDVRGVITHRFKVDDFVQGFDAMRGGSSGKVVLDWT